jgi:dTMP kinase
VGRGLFIVFEGTEGSGKSTQAQRLAGRLRDSGAPVLTTREPGGTEIGEAIRALLLSDEVPEPASRTQALLHTAARAEHVERVIRPALAAGRHVVCDRYYDSTLAYQGGASGLPLSRLRSLQEFAIDGCEPDVKILLLVSVEEGLRRRNAQEDSMNRMDRAERAFHERVRETFLALARDESERWIVIDGERPLEVISADLAAALEERFPALGMGR